MYRRRTNRKTQTSTAVKQRYKDKTYKRYSVYLRRVEDSDLINWVDSRKDSLGTTNVFRDALEMYMRSEDEE